MNDCVLVVDDEAHMRRILALQLQRAGFDVETASDGEEALEVLQDRIPMLIITDFHMPGMDGRQLCQALAANDRTRDIPVILLTGRGYELEAENLRDEANLIGLLCKPFSPEQLLEIVEATVHRGQGA